MSIYDTLNEQQRESGISHGGTGSDLGGCRFRKNEGSDTSNRLSDRRKGRESIQYYGDHLYEQSKAGEMRERIDQLVGYGSESIWVSTFHSTCVRILRRHIDRIGFDTNFTIYDSDDQKNTDEGYL